MNELAKVDSFRFLQWAAEKGSDYDELFYNLGLCKIGTFTAAGTDVWKSNDIHFLVTTKRQDFLNKHGYGVCGLGLNFGNADIARNHAIENGMRTGGNRMFSHDGIDGVEIFFNDYTTWNNLLKMVESIDYTEETVTGVNKIDHVTHNCRPGNVDMWAENYKNWFGMYQNKYFDIDGKETGLISRAMMSSIGNMAIPLNEDKDDRGQIAQFIRDFNGEGVQHIALETNDIYFTVKQLRKQGVDFLNVPDKYYDTIDQRIDEHNEDIDTLKELGILIDGGKEDGILLQIFTEPVVGPVFFEIIQRKGNKGFGHGNFKALFEAIERDQLNLN